MFDLDTILWHCIELFAIVFENYIILRFFNELFEPRYNKTRMNIGFVVFLAVLIAYSIFSTENILLENFLFLPIMVIALYSAIFLKGSFFQKSLLSVFCILIILIINILVAYQLSFIFTLPDTLFSFENDLSRLTGIFLSKVLFYLTLKITSKKIKHEQLNLTHSEYSVSIVVFGLTYIIFNLLILLRTNSKHADVFVLLSIAGIIVINIVVFFMIRKLSNANKNKLKLALLNLQLEEQKEIFLQAQYVSKDIKKVKHDLKHHLQAIKHNLDSGSLEDLKHYINNLILEHENDVFKNVFIDNSIINSVLNLKIAKCNECDIDIKIQIEDDFLSFDDIDICVLLSNLLDNAIEASINEDFKKITLTIFSKENYLCILVKNKISNSVLVSNKNLSSTKIDKDEHGFGIYSISKLCSKYNGMYNVYEDNNYFVSDIWLKKK